MMGNMATQYSLAYIGELKFEKCAMASFAGYFEGTYFVLFDFTKYLMSRHQCTQVLPASRTKTGKPYDANLTRRRQLD